MNKEYLITQWLKGECTPEELRELYKLPEYEDYVKILDNAHYFKAPSFDVDKAYSNFIVNKKSKKGYKLFWIAASIVALLGFFLLINNVSTTEATTDIAEHKEIILPDGSEVFMNASSNISFNKTEWNSDRIVQLRGEAYFKVEKGQVFDVITEKGKVSVLGTQFNVKNRNNIVVVETYEGLVQLETKDTLVLIAQGRKITLKQGDVLAEGHNLSEPHWSNGISKFESTPLSDVLDELEMQYDISLTRDILDQNQLFTGSFPHNNLTQALQSISIPMKLNYSFKEEKSVSLRSIDN